MTVEPATDDGFDFKPFFDLVVGMVFILLIMISAQLFFARWDQVTDPVEAQRLNQLRADEMSALLERSAETLRKGGLTITIQREAQALDVMLPPPTGPAGLPVQSPQAVTAVAAAVDVLACAAATGGSAPPCPDYQHIRVTAITPALRSPQARAAATLLAADLLRQSPAIAGLKAADGRSLLPAGLVQADGDQPLPAFLRIGVTAAPR